MDAETKAAKQRELIPYDARIQQFREMLAEKQVCSIEYCSLFKMVPSFQVSAFATWEQEISKISSDQRYLLLTAKERKQEFDRYTHGLYRRMIE